MHTPLIQQPAYLFGKLLALEKMVLAIGLMHATAPEVREQVLPELQHLLDAMTDEPIPEATLDAVRDTMRRVQRVGPAS